MEQVMQQRTRRSLLLIDIALPRDVEPSIAQLPGIHLYNLDDLQASVDEGVRLRLQEVEQVQTIIAEEVNTFERWRRSLSVTGTISDLRRHVDEVRRQELDRVLRQLSPGLDEREIAAVQQLTTRLVNKLLHIPTLRLKSAAAEGQGHIYTEAIRYLFDLEVQADEAYNHWHPRQQAGDDPDEPGSRATAPARSGDRHRADSHDG
jgi:glutamyl-tRNA reductase